MTVVAGWAGKKDNVCSLTRVLTVVVSPTLQRLLRASGGRVWHTSVLLLHPGITIRKLQSCPKQLKGLSGSEQQENLLWFFFVCFQLLAPAPSKDRKYYFWSANIRHVLPKNYIKLVLNFKMRH